MRLDRRRFLRAAGGTALALPWLQATHSRAGGAAAPKRLVVFFTNNGTVPDAWASGGENDFTLGEILAPLQPHRSNLLLMRGIDMESSHHGPGSGDPHMPGMAHCLTGTEMVTTGPGAYDMIGGGISVDQYIAEQLAAPTKFASLGFGVQAREYSSSPWNSLSYAGPNAPVDPQDDPQAAFDRIFMGFDVPMGEQETLRQQRLSVVDVVRADIEALRPRLGTEDRVRLDQHLEAMLDLQQSIESVTPTGGACQPPPRPSAIDGGLYAYENVPELFRVQSELLVMSLACDLTRVATLQFREALGGSMTFTFLGQNEHYHEISHKSDGDTVGRQQMIDTSRFFAEQFAYLIDLMAAVPEEDGTLLDNTCVLWVNELSKGNAHSRTNMHYVLAGGCQGAFTTGRSLVFSGAFHNDLLVSLCQAMDVDTDTFGNPAYCTGPLVGLA